MLCRKSQSNTGLPAHSDTGYSDIPVTVTVFWSKKGSPYTDNPGYSDILLTVTLYCKRGGLIIILSFPEETFAGAPPPNDEK